MTAPNDVEASIEFLPSESGGNRVPLTDGARPQFFYHGQDWDCELVFPETGRADPGKVVRAEIGFLSPQEHEPRLRVGSPFLIRYGSKTIGFGTVSKIVGLPDSAARARAKPA
jgi:translation elongation factor EF-Tu-like GTPase